MYEDETLVCRDCGQEFVFSASEQAFFAEKGFMNKPSRCPKCRAARRAQNGNGSSAPRQMYDVVCANCHRRRTAVRAGSRKLRLQLGYSADSPELSPRAGRAVGHGEGAKGKRGCACEPCRVRRREYQRERRQC